MSDHELVRLEYHEITASGGLAEWLAEEYVSLALTNGTRLFMVGVTRDGSLSVMERQYGACTAVTSVDSETLYLATRYQIWRLENALPRGELTEGGHDRLYLPQTAWTTGLLGVHDLASDATGRVIFVNGVFSCLATVSDTLNFEPLWVPHFISALLPENRCHLTGVVMVDGHPAFVTSASRADTREGWRDERRDGGVVLSVPDASVLAGGLSMPYSPVMHDGELWLCNGGTGELGKVDLARGTFEPMVQIPGLARGLALLDRYAVVGSTRPRWGETFGGLAVDDRLNAGRSAMCGVCVVGLETGAIEHSLRIDGVSPEIWDVVVLPGVRRPAPVAFQGDDIETLVTFASASDAGE